MITTNPPLAENTSLASLQAWAAALIAEKHPLGPLLAYYANAWALSFPPNPTVSQLSSSDKTE